MMLGMVPATPRSVRILGVSVDDVTEDEALSMFVSFVADGSPRRVVTPNPGSFTGVRNTGAGGRPYVNGNGSRRTITPSTVST